MKIRTKNSVWVSGAVLAVTVGAGFNGRSEASDIYNGTYPATSVAGDSCEITDQQQHMLDLINQARAQSRSCGDEFYKAALPVTWNCQLSASSAAHTNDMASVNFFGHTGSDGLRAGDRLLASGYDWHIYGENLAAGFVFSEEALGGFLGSPGHCANIMNPDITEFGSYMTFSDASDYRSYWVQLFATKM